MRGQPKKKVTLIACTLFFLFSFLVYQFYTIQIIQGKEWSEKARRQHLFVVEDPFQRGVFFSQSVRKTHPDKPQQLVLEIQKFHLYIDPLSIPKMRRDEICKHLNGTNAFTEKEKGELRGQFDKHCRSRKLAMWLDDKTKESMLSWWFFYAKKHKIPRNALYFVAAYKRSYPFGRLLGQVLHTVQDQRDESTKQAFPTGGLELYFDTYLKGKQGKRLLKRSPRHSFETGVVLETPENGADIYLTINHYLQAIAEEEIEIGVKRCQAKSGWAVMMEPKTGKILALAQYPFFFPEQYRSYFNDPAKIEHTKVKALTDANEPGSVIKPFTAIAALLANEELIAKGKKLVFDPEEKMPCSNAHFPGRIKPLRDVRMHKFLNLDMAMQKSSNIYFARLVERIVNELGKAWYRELLEEKFGFGKRTGLELPSESPGLLPRIGKTHPNGALEWSLPTPFSLAIGHNLQLNSLQLVRAFSLLANGGKLVKPTLICKIVRKRSDRKKETLFDNTAYNQALLPKVNPKIVERVVKAMKYTTKPGGSGYRADVFGYTEVGKTGTAHKIVNGVYSQTDFVASYIGFCPVSNPAFVLLVVMDEPVKRYIPGVGYNHRGSVAAAPVFKAIAKRSLKYLGIPQDDPHGYPCGDPRFDREKADWLLETRDLRALYQEWNSDN